MMVAATLFLLVAAPAHAARYFLVEARPGATAFLRLTGAKELAPSVGLWRVPAGNVPRLRDAGLVRLAEPERRLRPTRATLDPLVSDEWWLAKVGATNVAAPGPGVPVAVVDTGVDFSHPEFEGRPDSRPLNVQNVEDTRRDYHGTAVASIIGAPSNGVGIVGVYPQANILAFDADLSGSLSSGELIRGIDAAASQGPVVINLSLGGTHFDPLVRDVVLSAVRRGSLVVAASGNSGALGNPLTYPASLPHVLTVGATDANDQPAFFSNSSAAVDLAAPGVGITVAMPFLYDVSGYDRLDGTSFAAPMVSAAAALVWTVRPDLDNTQLFDLMRFSARDVWTRGFDRETGFGVVDISSALGDVVPLRDVQEPNDDVRVVKPGGLFASGSSPLTSRSVRNASVRATLDVTEDPVDLYRVWAPPHRAVTVAGRSTHGLRVRVWRPSTRSIGERGEVARRDLAASSPSHVRVVNDSKRGAFYYADVRLAGGEGNGIYSLTVKTSATAKR